jgi:hypothetical protein
MTNSELQVFIANLPTSTQAIELVRGAQQKKQDDDLKNKNYRVAKILDHIGNKIKMEAKQSGRGIIVDSKMLKMRFSVQEEDIFAAFDVLNDRGFEFKVSGGCSSVLISW